MSSDATAEGLTFDEFVERIEVWAGTEVGVGLQGPGERAGSTSLHVRGVLEAATGGEVQLINPRPGRVAAFRVGHGALVLHEGDFVEADVSDLGDTTVMSADFTEVTVLLSRERAAAA